MIGNGHVQFCSGRGRGNPPPDRNQLRLEGQAADRCVRAHPTPADRPSLLQGSAVASRNVLIIGSCHLSGGVGG